MNNCEHIKAQLLDLDVSKPIQDAKLAQHLEQCEACQALYQDLLAFQLEIDDLPEYDVSDDIFAETLAAVQQDAQQPQPKPGRINPQWATGLAACFVLVAVIGLLYNGTISEFQGDFSEVTVATEQARPDEPKETPWIDPEGEASTDITFELVGADDETIKRSRRVQALNAPAVDTPTAVGDTLKQINEVELGMVASEAPQPSSSVEKPAMPDLLREEAEAELFRGPEKGMAKMRTESEPVMEESLYEDRAKVVEKKKAAKPVVKTDKDQGPPSLDQLLKEVSATGNDDWDEPEAHRKARLEAIQKLEESQNQAVDKNTISDEESKPASDQMQIFRPLDVRPVTNQSLNQAANPEPASPPVDGVVAQQPERQNLNEANQGQLRKDNRQADQAGAGFKREQDQVDVDRITVTGSRIRQAPVDMTEESGYVDEPLAKIINQKAVAYLETSASTEDLTFKAASGYWANTYVPGDSDMRWYQAYLQQHDTLALPAVGQNLQPFDAPNNSALALYLNSDRSTLDTTGQTRMRLQVGLQAGKQQGGHRSALNLALVLDLGDQPVQDEVKALLSALLKNKRSSDQVSVFVTGPGGGQVIQADDFRHGPIQVTLNELFTQDSQPNQPHIGLEQSIASANAWLKTQDDPNAVLGSSAIWLVSAQPTQVSQSLQDKVHEQATEGITFSTLAISPAAPREVLERLALQGQGHSRVMAGVTDAERVIKAEMMSASRAVARALRLQIRLADGVQLVNVLGSYSLNEAQAQQVRAAENSLDQRMAKNLGIEADRGKDEDGIQMVIPSFFAGDTHVVLLDVVVNHHSSQSKPIAEVNVKYKDLIYLRNAKSSQNLELSVGENQLTPLELNVMKNVLAFRVAETMKRAAGLLNSGDQQRAVFMLTDLSKLLASLRQHIPAWREDQEIMRDEQVIKQYLNLLDSQSSLNPDQYRLIVTSLNVNSWRRLLTHSP